VQTLVEVNELQVVRHGGPDNHSDYEYEHDILGSDLVEETLRLSRLRGLERLWHNN